MSEKTGLKKLWQKASFKIGGTVTLIGGLITAFFFVVKQPNKPVDAGAGIGNDTLIHVVAGDSAKADTAK